MLQNRTLCVKIKHDKLCSKMQSAKIYNLSKGKGVDMKVEKYRRKYQRRRGLYERLSDICFRLEVIIIWRLVQPYRWKKHAFRVKKEMEKNWRYH